MVRPREAVSAVRHLRFPRAYNHMEAERVRRLVNPEVWSGYFKFSIERNPWDAMVSSYFWATRNDGERRPSFETFLDSIYAQRLANNWLIYAIGTKVVADRVYRYEDLQAEMTALGGELRLPTPLELPRAKGNTRPATGYVDYYTETLIRRVGAMCARQIELMGYRFGE